MATTSEFLVGLAEHLAAAGVGTWSPSGVFTAADTAIVLRVVPPTPDRVITLTPYTVEDGVNGDSVQGVQLRTRAAGMPTEVDDLDDEIYQALHRAEGLDFGGHHISLAWRQSHGPVGVDGEGRHVNSGNYYFRVARPTPHTR